MVQEDYVSFEVAELLKNKGFDEYCRAVYGEGETEIEITDEYWRNTDSDIREIDDEDDDSFVFITAPTLQMAMKWLRERHGIHIVIHPSSGVYYGKYCLSIYVQRVKNKNFNLTYQTHEDTYEKAVEEGISYSLINLI